MSTHLSYETPFRGPRGYFHVKVYNRKTRKRTTRSTRKKTAREAMEVIQDWKADESAGWDFRRAWEAYVKFNRSRVSEATYKQTDAKGRNQFLPVWGEKEIGDLTTRDLEEWLSERSQKVKHSTLNGDLALLKAFFRWCLRHGLISRTPAGEIKPYRVVEKEPRVLTEEEDLRLAYGLRELYGDSWEPLWYEIAISSGFRSKTMNLLTRAHFDLKEELWKIPGEAMKAGQPLYCPMTPRARKALEKLLSLHEEWELFPEATPSIVRGFLDRTAEAVGVDPFGTHVLRKTFITWVIRRGCDLKMAQKLTGIRSLQILQRHYYEVRIRDMAPVVKGIEALKLSDDKLLEGIIHESKTYAPSRTKDWRKKKARPFAKVISSAFGDTPTAFLPEEKTASQ